MDREEINSRLSRISTVWTDVIFAHDSAEPAHIEHRHQLLARYQHAIYRYLLGGVRDADAADELFQEFALQFLRGGLRHAQPERGRFRDYLKSSLVHLIGHYRKRRSRKFTSLDSLTELPVPDASQDDPGQGFTELWRSELMACAWAALLEVQRQTGQPLYAVLRFRAENPQVPSAQMARQLTEQLRPEKPFTDTGIRKTLQRARERFAQLLLAEVVRSLEDPSPAAIEEELIELRLLEYCRAALDRRR